MLAVALRSFGDDFFGRDEDLDCVEEDVGFFAGFAVGAFAFGLAAFDRADAVLDFDVDNVFGLAPEVDAFKFEVAAVAFGFADALALGFVRIFGDLPAIFFTFLPAFDDFAFVDVDLAFDFAGFFFAITI